jgi:hypothetical protein
LEPTGRLATLRMVPLRIRTFNLERASHAEAPSLEATLDRESLLDPHTRRRQRPTAHD